MNRNADNEQDYIWLRPQNLFLALLLLFTAVQAFLIPQMTEISLLFLLLVLISQLLRWLLSIRPEWMLLDLLLLATLVLIQNDNSLPVFLVAMVFYFMFHKRWHYALPTAIFIVFSGGLRTIWWIAAAVIAGCLLLFWEMDQRFRLAQTDKLRKQIYRQEQMQDRLLSDFRSAEKLTRLEERQKLAELLHDNLGHDLTAADLSQKAASALLRAGDYGKAGRMLAQTEERLQIALEQLKKSVRTIEPDTIAGEDEFRKLLDESVYPVEFIHSGSLLQVKPHIWQPIIMTAREALTNIGKHARPSKVTVDLTVTDYIVRMTIANDGVIAGSSQVQGSGLRYMRARLEAIGGSLSIQPTKQQFLLIMTIPLGRTY